MARAEEPEGEGEGREVGAGAEVVAGERRAVEAAVEDTMAPAVAAGEVVVGHFFVAD